MWSARGGGGWGAFIDIEVCVKSSTYNVTFESYVETLPGKEPLGETQIWTEERST